MSNPNKGFILLVCFALVMFGSCSEKKGPSKKTSPESITVKGFKLGMNFAEAQGNALRLFEETDYDRGPTVEFVRDHTEIGLALTEFRPVVIHLYKDAANRLTRIEMSSYATDAFF